MDIGTVVRALRNGGRLRRRAWAAGYYIESESSVSMQYPSDVIYMMPGDGIWRPLAEDVLAEDWETV